jgi:hypothetical protein
MPAWPAKVLLTILLVDILSFFGWHNNDLCAIMPAEVAAIPSDYFVKLQSAVLTHPVSATIAWAQLQPSTPQGEFTHPQAARTYFLAPTVQQDTTFHLQVTVREPRHEAIICQDSIALLVKQRLPGKTWTDAMKVFQDIQKTQQASPAVAEQTPPALPETPPASVPEPPSAAEKSWFERFNPWRLFHRAPQGTAS